MGIVEVSIEVTNECTLSCLHCSSGSVPKRVSNELTYQNHRRILAEARDLGATVLSLSGGNPLLYAPLDELIYEAQKLGFQRILLYSTGHNRAGEEIMFYPGITWLLNSVPQMTYIFSLHSHIPTVNDYIMNTPGATRVVERSIAWLGERGQSVEIHMVPMAPNFRHITQVRDLCQSLGVKTMSLLRFVPQTRGRLNKDALDMSQEEFAEMQINLDMELRRKHLVALRAGCPIDFRHIVGLTDGKTKPCHAGDDLMLVRPTGAVHPCAAWKSLPADSNVRESSLQEIWDNSEVFRAIREFKAQGYTEVNGCSGCTLLNTCKAGCPAQRLHAHRYPGNGMDSLYDRHSDPMCGLTCVKE